MINRYQNNEITKIWSTEAITNRWLKLELFVLEGWYKSGLIPVKDFEFIKENIKIDLVRWKEIEQTSKHEFASFIRMLEEQIPNNIGKWIHYGLTSSDILDSATSIGIIDTINYISNLLIIFEKKLLDIRDDNKNLFFCGRTHGQIAEEQKFSDLVNRWLSELKRSKTRLNNAYDQISVIKLSGPVGNYTVITKEIEKFVCMKLGDNYSVADNSSQIISRDIFVEYFYAIAMIASCLEKIATYIRLLSLSGIDEIHEGFSNNQIGSSAMPHKKNPIICENICGLSRMIKSYLITAIDNNNSWLERDMSHSSIERITIEDSAHLICHSINNIINVFSNLQINKLQMQNNVNRNLRKLQSHKRMLEFIKLNDISRKEAHEKIMNEM